MQTCREPARVLEASMIVRTPWKRLICFCVFSLLTILSQVATGQAVNGTLLGTVTDATGAAVPSAKVVIKETSTSLSHESLTNGSGNYAFPDLPPGAYTVSAELAGFKRASQEIVQLLSNSTIRVDITMQPGNVTETVTVTTAPPVLQTARADISTKIDSPSVMALPLTTGRNFQSLLNLVPGTSPATFQHSQFFNAQNSLQTQANGMPRVSNLYQIEGIDDDERTGLLQILIPPAEAIQSVDVSTNNYEPELGRSVGAITNVTLKAGTNNFHGSAFEYLQNNAVNARSYFGPKLGHLSYNYFGGSFGGPIKKDKLFFFGDYLRTIDSERVSSTFTVPDARWYTNAGITPGCTDPAGCVDLSGALQGTTGQIYDPNTGDGSSIHPRTPFTNNQIPISRINAVSLNMLQQLNAAFSKYGKLDSTKPLSSPTNNYSTNLPFRKDAHSFDVKVDWILREKDHLNGRFSWQRTNTFQAAAFGNSLGGPQGGGIEAEGNQTAYSAGGIYY